MVHYSVAELSTISQPPVGFKQSLTWGVFIYQVNNADFDDDEDRDLSTTRAKIALETLQTGVAREGVSVRVCVVLFRCPPSSSWPMIYWRTGGCKWSC